MKIIFSDFLHIFSDFFNFSEDSDFCWIVFLHVLFDFFSDVFQIFFRFFSFFFCLPGGSDLWKQMSRDTWLQTQSYHLQRWGRAQWAEIPQHINGESHSQNSLVNCLKIFSLAQDLAQGFPFSLAQDLAQGPIASDCVSSPLPAGMRMRLPWLVYRQLSHQMEVAQLSFLEPLFQVAHARCLSQGRFSFATIST